MKTYYFYILASRKNGTLYSGETSDLAKRVAEHNLGVHDGSTKTYGVHDLVYFEETNDIRVAIERETNIKNWKRRWKIRLIEKENPAWRDLAADWN